MLAAEGGGMEEGHHSSATTVCLKDRGTAAAIHKQADGTCKQDARTGEMPSTGAEGTAGMVLEQQIINR